MPKFEKQYVPSTYELKKGKENMTDEQREDSEKRSAAYEAGRSKGKKEFENIGQWSKERRAQMQEILDNCLKILVDFNTDSRNGSIKEFEVRYKKEIGEIYDAVVKADDKEQSVKDILEVIDKLEDKGFPLEGTYKLTPFVDEALLHPENEEELKAFVRADQYTRRNELKEMVEAEKEEPFYNNPDYQFSGTGERGLSNWLTLDEKSQEVIKFGNGKWAFLTGPNKGNLAPAPEIKRSF